MLVNNHCFIILEKLIINKKLKLLMIKYNKNIFFLFYIIIYIMNQVVTFYDMNR